MRGVRSSFFVQVSLLPGSNPTWRSIVLCFVVVVAGAVVVVAVILEHFHTYNSSN